MDTLLKEEWISALESPARAQTTAYLRTNEGNCVLGVLAEIVVQHGLAEWVLRSERACACCKKEVWYLQAGREAQYGCLPTLVREWVGLSKAQEEWLYERNDEGANFHDLALWIKENV